MSSMKYPYRDLGVPFDRNFRNDLNANFDDIEHDIRMIGGEAAQQALEAAEEANTQAIYAQTSGDYANDKGDYAAQQGDFAQTQGNYANEKGLYAQQQGDYAKAQGDYAKQVGDENKTRWLTAVNTYADIATTYPNPQLGDTVQTIDDSKIYRWDGTQWVWTQQYNANAITDVQNKIGILSSSVYVESFPIIVPEVDDTARIQRAIDEASNKKAELKFPEKNVTYNISSELQIKPNMTIDLGKSTIKATASMPAVFGTDKTVRIDGIQIRGKMAKIDCNGLAQIGIHIRCFTNLTIESIYIENPALIHIKLGDSTAAYSSYQATLYNVLGDRQRPIPQPPGSIGLLLENCTDSTFTRCVFVGAETGVKTLTGASGHVFNNVHVWSRLPENVMTTSFDIASADNIFIGCISDTPTMYGFRFSDGWRNHVIGCKMYNNGQGTSTSVGIRVESGVQQCSFIGNIFSGTSGHEIAKDIDFAETTYMNTFTITGSTWVYCNTKTLIAQGMQRPDSTTNMDFEFRRGDKTYWQNRVDTNNDYIIVERNTDGTFKRDALRFVRNTGVAKFGGIAIGLTPLTDSTQVNGQYNVLFVDTDGKLKFKDGTGYVYPLY